MTVYLLHFNQPLPRGVSKKGTPLTADHYIGYTDDLVGRILAHFEGKSNAARIMQVLKERGITFSFARSWDGLLASRGFERRLKRYGKARLLCPICNPKALNNMQLEYVSPESKKPRRRRREAKEQPCQKN